MLCIKRIVLLVCLCAGAFSAVGQEKGLRVRCYGSYDYHIATGSRGAFAASGDYAFGGNYSLQLGLNLATGSRTALNLQGEAVLGQWERGKLVLQHRYLYRVFPQWNVQEFTGALNLGWRGGHWDLMLGLANRYTAEQVQRTRGGESTVLEPMNVMFAAEYSLWPEVECDVVEREWNVSLRWSSYNDFEIERVAMWFYSVKGYYLLNGNTRLIGEAGIHPVGSLNLTSSYNGWWINLGAMFNIVSKSGR